MISQLAASTSELFSLLPWIDDGMAEQAGGWLWQSDQHHRFFHLSPGVARIVGRPADWHYGKTREELGNISVHSSPAAAEWLAQLERREPFGPFEFTRHQGDRVVRLRTLGIPVSDWRGQFRGYRGIAFEVSGPPVTDPGPRLAPRRQAMLMADLVLPGLGLPIACRTRDLSAEGACLEIETKAPVPERIVLRLAIEDRMHNVECAVLWQKDGVIGVRFLRSLELPSGPMHQDTMGH